MPDPVNILLVDDQPAKLMSYEVILRHLGENLITAASGAEALQHIWKTEIAVILIDVCMPGLDGFELAAIIREHPRFCKIAMIFVSAVSVTEFDRLKGYEHGAVDYVAVPVIPELLRAKVRVFAELYRKSRQLEMLNVELERRVEARTAELATVNLQLERRVEERTRESEAALAQVHEMQKLEGLGQLTGGLAHDFNNLLTAVLGNLELIKRKMPEESPLLRLVNGATAAAERGAVLTRRLLAFARRQQLQPEVLDVQHLIEGMADMLRSTLGPTIAIDLNFEAEEHSVRVDRNELELAFLNLALNGRDAMPKGGPLIIATSNETVGPEHQGLAAGDYVCVSVRDAGTGMDDATRQRAAEPFFTTKGLGAGTGLGLSMVHGLAAQLGGLMRISSALGSGTLVEVLLPVDKNAVAAMSPPRTVIDDASIASCSVLIVDDDDMVVETTANMLVDLRHTVQVCASGALAMERIRSGAAIDLVITDQVMPGMSGMELIKQIRETRPKLPTLLVTGYNNGEHDDAMVPVLRKPFSQVELKRMISTLVRQAAPH